MMDWTSAAITAGLVVAGHAVTYISTNARHDQRIGTVEEVQQQHGKRLDEHDKNFQELSETYVPRPELSETLNAIKASQQRTERWIERLLFKTAGVEKIGDQ